MMAMHFRVGGFHRSLEFAGRDLAVTVGIDGLEDLVGGRWRPVGVGDERRQRFAKSR